MRRLLVLAAVSFSLFAPLSAAAAATTTTQPTDPAQAIYQEQLPTANGSSDANAVQPADATTSSSSGGAITVAAVVAALVVLAGIGVYVVRSRRGGRPVPGPN